MSPFSWQGQKRTELGICQRLESCVNELNFSECQVEHLRSEMNGLEREKSDLRNQVAILRQHIQEHKEAGCNIDAPPTVI